MRSEEVGVINIDTQLSNKNWVTSTTNEETLGEGEVGDKVKTMIFLCGHVEFEIHVTLMRWQLVLKV